MSCLFETFTVRSLALKNRFVRSATGEGRADHKGIIREQMYPIYAGLAAGGVGTIITGHMYVHEDWKCSPGQTGIWSDEHITGLARLARESQPNAMRPHK